MKTIEVVAALLCRPPCFLICRRPAHKTRAGLYEFPGGKIEQGESGDVAVKRELLEELNMQVKVGGLYASHTHEYPDFIITLWLYECEMLSDFVLKEHESYAWIAPADLKEEEWAPADADILGTLKRVFGE